VMFRGAAPEGLGIPGLTIYSDVATGTVNRRQIEELAQRDDVVTIESRAEMQFH
jgi:hypothetical protein